MAEQDGSERPPAPSPGQAGVDDEVYKSVADAYYRKAIDAPKRARTNSQNAYTIAAAVAAAVVTAGAFADLAAEPLGVRIVGIAALVAWLLTAALFMYAVAAPYVRAKSEKSQVFTKLAFVEEAMRSAKNESETINNRQLRARLTAALASLLTVLVVALALFSPATSDKRATVKLSPGDQRNLSEICRQKVPTLMTGTVDPNSLDGTVEFDPDEGQCKTPGAATLQEKRTTFILAP